jgi:hypothetical protein
MARLSFALYEAWLNGASAEALADRLGLPIEWVTERIEAARLCLVCTRASKQAASGGAVL